MRPKQDTILHVEQDTLLISFLQSKMGGMAKASIKQLLGQRRVKVNNVIQTRHDTPIRRGNTVVISSGRGNIELRHPKLRIIYEDDALIVVDKKNGLLTVPVSQTSKETTVYSILKEYVKKQSYRNTVHVVHRLDRETSGLLVFAKTPELQEYMRTYWRQLVTKRTYVAVLEGDLSEKEGKITSWLTENNRTALVSSSPVDNGGQLAITNYRVLKECSIASERGFIDNSLVELNLETGRTNQIRVHMASIGHPVVGDRKYGNGNVSSPIDRLCLHARMLEFIHPMTERKVCFESPLPKEFTQFFKS